MNQQTFTGERALFSKQNLEIYDSTFCDGESPLKHSKDIDIYDSLFKWKYPLWYSENVRLANCTLFENARAGIWYTNNIEMKNSIVIAPKNFRRCDGVVLSDVDFSDAAETMWSCKNIKLENVTVNGNYFAMNSENITADNLKLVGGYCFDGCKNVTVKNSKLVTKDAFWNSENVTVTDSYISSEYIGWNSKNLTFVNCTIESLQGFCYIENLKLVNCRTVNTTLAFEYSTVNAEIDGRIDSIFNPAGGEIHAQSVGEIIMQEDRVDTSKTKIVTGENNEV